MLSGVWLIPLLLLAIVFIVIMTGKVRMNAFLVLILAALFVGLLAADPPLISKVGKDGQLIPGVIETIASGFGNTLASIGIVIVAGTIIAKILDKTGAAVVMARTMLKLVGKKNSPLAMAFSGYLVSIPVFCDSGFIILSPLNRALSQSSGISLAVLGTALSMGLYTTHSMVPPTPGPIAAAGNLGADLGLVIILGLIASVPGTIAGWLYALKVGSKIKIIPKAGLTYEEMLKDFGKLPSTLGSFLPIIVPIILMALRSIANLGTNPLGHDAFKTLFGFIGNPNLALLIGVFLAMMLARRFDSRVYGDWVSEAIKDSAIILVITAAGGSFGAVLQATGIGSVLGDILSKYNLGIFLPFIIAAAIKTAQGSSTVSMITTSAMLAPLLPSLGFGSPMARALFTIAIGAGSIVVSHANGSYFWVVSQLSEMDINQAYRMQTGGTLFVGLVSIATIAIMAAILL